MWIARLVVFWVWACLAFNWYDADVYDRQFLLLFGMLGFVIIEAAVYIGDRIKESRVA